MASLPTLALVFSVVVAVACAQTTRLPTTRKPPTTTRLPTRDSYSAFNFPNPQVDYAACGLMKPGWVCDPGRILKSYQLEDLEGIIDRIHRLKDCSCADCNATSLSTAAVLPAVAIVPKITGAHITSDEKMDAVKDFGRSLREEHWNYGAGCDNDFVLTLAIKERKVWTTVGVKAQVEGMAPHCVTDAFTKHRSLFGDAEYGDGLQLMMDEFRKMLAGITCEDEGSELSVGTWAAIGAGILGAIGGCIGIFCCCSRGCCDGCEGGGGGGGGGSGYHSSSHHYHHGHYDHHHGHYGGSSWGGGGGGGGGDSGGGGETGGDGGGGGF